MIKLVKKEIEIKFISADDWKGNISEGWFNSRPELKRGDDLNFVEILKIDTPVSELGSITLEFTVPILFREIFCSPRDHIVWARTSRVDNLLESWNVTKYITEDQERSIIELQNKILIESKEVTQDEFRKNLPLSYMTSFTSRVSIRSAIKLLKYFYGLKKYAPISEPAKDFSEKFAKVLRKVGVPVDAIFASIKEEDYCPMIQTSGEKEFIDNNDHYIIKGTFSLMLRAQIIRHRTLHVVDDLSKYFSAEDVWSTPVSDNMKMSISATKTVWSSIISKRTCWLAHSSIWGDIINDISEANAGSIERLIPCADGVCPYNEDCRQRVLKNDPGLPCPRHIHLSKENDLLQQVKDNFDINDLSEKMKEYVIKSSRPINYWNKQIEEFKND